MVGNGGSCIIIQLIILLVSNTYNLSAKGDVYIVLLKSPSLIHRTKLMQSTTSIGQEDYMEISNEAMIYRSLLVQSHDNLLEAALGHGAVERKLYSYSYLINGFAASMSSQEATLLQKLPEVVKIERDERMQKLTTYTPTYLDLPNSAWRYSSFRGVQGAGEGIVIGMVDTGIDPTHPSFANTTFNPYYNAKDILGHFKGQCEVGHEFPQSSCNGKIIAAQHFAKAAKVSGLFNADIDYDSPFDGDGHGTHTASIAAGNYGIAVKVAGMFFGNASGMAPRARLAIYKALYPRFGGFYSDVVAALEKAVEDGVDILNLSIGPSTPPRGVATYFNTVDLALLAAVKAGVFVVQAAGNAGPSPFTVVSFSPWIFTVAATQHDRTYSNSIILGNNLTITGLGLSPGTQGSRMHSLVLAKEAIRNYTVAKEQRELIEECQDALNFEKGKVEGKILVCTYTFNFLIGRASMKNVEATAKGLSASGVLLTMSAWMQGFNLHAESMPFKTPVIIIPYANASKDFMNYYTQTSQSYVEGASGRIVGVNARYSYETPRVAAYSSRGPDPSNSYYRAADVLKPNVAAPGSFIWGAWTPNGVDAQYFKGEKFAMISGTSMATPHIVGIAALVKQKNPKLSVAGIASAISTASSIKDSKGRPLLLETSTGLFAPKSSKLATPFDMGSGLVNATAAIYPGLIFDAGYQDYVRFLCTVQGAEEKVKEALGESCEKATSSKSKELSTDLNAPYITVAKLQGKLKVVREVAQVGMGEETYIVSIEAPKRVSVEVTPSTFTLESYKSQKLQITLTPSHDLHSHTPRFGSILFTGNLGHFARIPISIISINYTHHPPPSN